MGSSTTDIRQPINERQRERILELVFQLNKFTLQEIIDESGIHPKVVEQFLQSLCYQEVLNFVINEYQVA